LEYVIRKSKYLEELVLSYIARPSQGCPRSYILCPWNQLIQVIHKELESIGLPLFCEDSIEPPTSNILLRHMSDQIHADSGLDATESLVV
jgi:hypothetical protein